MRYAAVLLLAAGLAVTAAGYDFSAVDSLLSDSLSRLGGGCALLLIKDGRVVYRKAFGRYSCDMVVPIASATKWLSAGVINSLISEGRLSLNDTCGEFLPLYTGVKAQMTLRQLFSHTSGLPGSSEWISTDVVSLAQAVDSIAAEPQRTLPGTDFYYGGVSMHVAGRIAEIAGGDSLPSGMMWDSLFQWRICRPLGITHTDFKGLGVTDNPRIAGGARSSADDYGRYLQMLLQRGWFQGRQVLDSAVVESSFVDQTRGVPIVSTPYENYEWLDSTLPLTRYGIGCWRERVDSVGQITELASQGAFGFSPWLDLSRNLVGVLSVRSLLHRVMPTYWYMKQLVRSAIDSGSVAVGEERFAPYAPRIAPEATIVRGMLRMAGLGHNPDSPGGIGLCPAHLLDITGRKVMELQPGENVVRHLAPGVYFVTTSSITHTVSDFQKVILTR